jgi:hypothetical protein
MLLAAPTRFAYNRLTLESHTHTGYEHHRQDCHSRNRTTGTRARNIRGPLAQDDHCHTALLQYHFEKVWSRSGVPAPTAMSFATMCRNELEPTRGIDGFVSESVSDVFIATTSLC